MTEAKFTLHTGHTLEVLASLPKESVQTCVTSPPYWGLRDYGLPTSTWPTGWVGQHGLEPTPALYVAHEVCILKEVWRVLKENGTLWLNLGDSYSSGGNGGGAGLQRTNKGSRIGKRSNGGFPSKQLIGIPWRVAFALQEAGWYLRSDIIWAKPNPMPESVLDRPTRSHEYIFLLTKKAKYFYDSNAIKEPSKDTEDDKRRLAGTKIESKSNPTDLVNGLRPRKDKQRGHGRRHEGFNGRWEQMDKATQQSMGRNKRSVWNVAPNSFPEAHFATFPPELITPCILAGSRPGDTVLDPFSGSGTTGIVSLKHGRRYVGIDLNPEYNRMAEGRLGGKIYERPKGKEVQQQPTLF